jgi:nitrate/TMAO reductase-like tetraheme cytochrome c subunit
MRHSTLIIRSLWSLPTEVRMKSRRGLILQLAAVFLVSSIAASVLLADGAQLVYQPPHDIAEEWAKSIGLVVAVIAAGLILYTITLRRSRLDEAGTKWILFLGVCLLPIPVALLSTAVGLEQSKKVSFCNSCHVMHVFVNDMRDPDAEPLAAIHYKNRYIQREFCYRCHTNYGVFGDVEAKKAGLTHIWKETSGTYHLPVEISKPYRYTICLDCHGQSAKFLAEESHDGVVAEVLAGDMICMDCHDMAHPPREERSTE